MNTENIINSNEIDQNEIESDSLAAMLTGEERAERGLINSLEARRTNVRTASGECWLSATEGECPPLGSNVPFERFYEQAITSQGKSPLSPAAQRNESKKVTKSSTPLPILRPPRISNRSATTGGHVSMVRGNPEKRVNAMDTRLRFQQAVQAVRSNSRLANEDNIPLNTVTNRRHHRRSTSRAQIFLDSIQNDDENMPEEAVRSVSSTNMSSDNALPPNEETQGQSYKQHRRGISLTMTESAQFLVDNLVVLADDTTHQFQGRTKEAGHLQDIARKTTESSDDSRDLFPVISTSTLTDVELGGENIPLLSTGDNSQRENFNETAPQKKNESYCDDARSNKGHERKASEATLTAASIYRRKRQNKQTKLQKIKDSFIQCCNPLSLFTMFYRRFQKSYFLLAALPLCVTSLILFYFLGNPRFYFLPGAATLAWWLNFFGKECILLELARYIQWLVIDYGVLRTQFGVKCLGPFVTLLCIQSKGWPFIAMTWSTLDLFLLHGNDHFQQHWLYFTNIRFYHEANSGSYVLVSELYLRLLLSMMLVGFATTLKRSTVAVAFGRRTFSMFKPRLETILKDIIVLSEVAELADETNRFASGNKEEKLQRSPSNVNILGTNFNWARDRLLSGDGPIIVADGSEFNDEITENSDLPEDDGSQWDETRSIDVRKNSTGSLDVKDLLDKWDEPVNRMDKSMNTSVRDILKFRRALTFIDDDNPFGTAFGPAACRDQVLKSAETVYHRLLKLYPDSTFLPYEIFEMLIDDEDEDIVNDVKRKALKKMFRPNASNEVSLLAFLQSCDALYKKLRFFRASVGNASVIDKALEEMINCIFYFIVVLIVLSFLKINPWPLLVSMSTLLVSVSFAVGSSASKYIEGIILIAVRRPYDLGDRIYMMDPSQVEGGFINRSWFIEDINLSFTTVRYAGSNEVATLSNGSIAGLRIVNGNRSLNAIISFDIPFHISIANEQKDKLIKLRSLLEKYVRDFPNHWKCVIYCRVGQLDVELEKASIDIAFQHQSSWQDLGRIMVAKADLICHVYELSKILEASYSHTPKPKLLYYGGSLKDGRIKDYRKDLTTFDNIKYHEDPTHDIKNDSFISLLEHGVKS